MKCFLFGWLVLCISCSSAPTKTTNQPLVTGDSSVYVWQKILDSADWKKNYNFQLFSFRDTLWTFHPDANWYSIDEGQHWTKSPLSNVINNHAFLDYVIFKNAVFGLGYFDGNIETHTFKPQIYRSDNMRSWELLSAQSNLPQRFFYHPFVFQDKIWIIGGEDKNQQYEDIWNSEDGIQWVQQKDKLPFAKRSGSIVVQLKDKLSLLSD